MNIAIIDYGLGNLQSVAGAVIKLGHTPIITNRQEDLERADKLILPGVGAFSDGMKNIKELGILDSLTKEVIIKKKPILGICLGCQLMAKDSFEFGHHEGLGWIDASVLKLEPNDKSLRVPHVGWDDLIKMTQNEILLSDVPNDALFYYTHSYHLKCKNTEDVIGTCEYGMTFHAAIHKGNIYGTQFHPEKSQFHGLTVLKNFIERG